MAFSRTCPFCDHIATIGDSDRHFISGYFSIENSDGPRFASLRFIVCPNPQCKKISLDLFLFKAIIGKGTAQNEATDLISSWPLIPSSKAKTFPDFVPKPILDDYIEACLIKDLSPKASAALARRCLQGMIRDFWAVKANTLGEEIKLIESKIDKLTWDAIEGTRKIGNIGAHMEKDINLIIEVDPNESELLINLIEMLIKDWYINKFEKETKLMAIKKIADDKEKERKRK